MSQSEPDTFPTEPEVSLPASSITRFDLPTREIAETMAMNIIHALVTETHSPAYRAHLIDVLHRIDYLYPGAVPFPKPIVKPSPPFPIRALTFAGKCIGSFALLALIFYLSYQISGGNVVIAIVACLLMIWATERLLKMV